ncbi:unnamed protein product [Moneuplotes crassus]|uniref:Thioredoxin domain-containing protein n=2 Tax=Euplotes crassus TaxID=5936 RepID=A0AAD1XV46_EUPCR|nr:unnamed protein product [Moneuplotes crassus]
MKELDTIEEFNDFLNDNPGKLVVIDFFATWCGPCQFIGPYVEQLAEADKLKGKAVFAKVDVDKNDDASAEYGVEAMPTFMLFLNGSKVDSVRGADIRKLITKIETQISKL